jgi:hypothetical protein
MEIRDFEDFLRYPDKEVIAYLKKNRYKFYLWDSYPFKLLRVLFRQGKEQLIIAHRISETEKCNKDRINIDSSIHQLNDTTYIDFKKQYIQKYNLAIKNIKVLKRILMRIIVPLYGEERFQLKTINNNTLQLIIHYPEITITNSFGLTRKLMDIFIKYEFTTQSGYAKLYNIEYLRTTFTSEEVFYRYSFSHVSCFPGYTFTSAFCFGETEFSKQITKLRQIVSDENSLYQLFLGFDKYLQWESIEGRPYKYLKDVKSVRYNSFHPNESQNNTMYEHVINNIDNFKYRIGQDTGEFHINIDDKNNLYSTLEGQLINRDEYKQLFCNIDNSGEDCIIEKLNNTRSINQVSLDFNGTIYSTKIVPSKESSTEYEKHLSKKIFNNAIQQIEKEFTNHFIEEYA